MSCTKLSGDSHPKMQASDRLLELDGEAHSGDSHPKMQACDREEENSLLMAAVIVTQKCKPVTGAGRSSAGRARVIVTQKCKPVTGVTMNPN